MNLFFNIFSRLSAVFLIMLAGYVFRKTNLIDAHTSKGLAKLVMNVTLPIMILMHLQMPFSTEVLISASVFALLFVLIAVLGFAIGWLTGRLCKLTNKQNKMWIFCCTITNTGLIGTAVITALFGSQDYVYLPIAIVISNLLLFAVGPLILDTNSPAGQTRLIGAAKLLINPGIIGFILGALMFSLSITVPTVLAQPMNMMGSMTTPLALLITGGALATCDLRQAILDWRLYVLSSIRLIIIPAMLLLALPVFFQGELLVALVLLNALSAPATLTSLAEKYDCDPAFAAQITFISTLLGCITIPIVASFVL